MKLINYKTIEVAGKKLSFPKRIYKALDFDGVLVLLLLSEPNDIEFNDNFQKQRVFGIDKNVGEIIWKMDGDDIQKVPRETIIFVPNIDSDPANQKFDLIVNYPSMNAHVDPYTGKVIGHEQTK